MRRDASRRPQTLQDASETPLRRDFEAIFDDFDVIFGMFFGAFSLARVLTGFLFILNQLFDVFLDENLMNKPCSVYVFFASSTLTKHRYLRIETHIFNFGVFCERPEKYMKNYAKQQTKKRSNEQSEKTPEIDEKTMKN